MKSTLYKTRDAGPAAEAAPPWGKKFQVPDLTNAGDTSGFRLHKSHTTTFQGNTKHHVSNFNEHRLTWGSNWNVDSTSGGLTCNPSFWVPNELPGVHAAVHPAAMVGVVERRGSLPRRWAIMYLNAINSLENGGLSTTITKNLESHSLFHETAKKGEEI